MTAKRRNAVATTEPTEKLLNELAEQRKKDGSFITSKVSIVAELIMKAHKKECK